MTNFVTIQDVFRVTVVSLVALRSTWPNQTKDWFERWDLASAVFSWQLRNAIFSVQHACLGCGCVRNPAHLYGRNVHNTNENPHQAVVARRADSYIIQQILAPSQASCTHRFVENIFVFCFFSQMLKKTTKHLENTQPHLDLRKSCNF